MKQPQTANAGTPAELAEEIKQTLKFVPGRIVFAWEVADIFRGSRVRFGQWLKDNGLRYKYWPDGSPPLYEFLNPDPLGDSS